MALSDLKQTKNKWALHAWKDHAIFIKLGGIGTSPKDYQKGECILIEELYQTNPVEKLEAISIGSNFDRNAIVCRENIVEWLKIFYPNLQEGV